MNCFDDLGPNVTYVDLLAPFWLFRSPPPVPAAERKLVFDTAVKMSELPQFTGAGSSIKWRVNILDWHRSLSDVSERRIWHPYELVQRKGNLLFGVPQGTEPLPPSLDRSLASFPEYSVEIFRRQIVYFDYGLGMLEYRFRIKHQHTISPAIVLNVKDSGFWRTLKRGLSDVWLGSELEILKVSNWNSIFHQLQNILCESYLKNTTESSANKSHAARTKRELLNIKHLFNLTTSCFSSSAQLNGLHQERKSARACRNFGIAIYMSGRSDSREHQAGELPDKTDTTPVSETPHLLAEKTSNNINFIRIVSENVQVHQATSEYIEEIHHGPIDSAVIFTPSVTPAEATLAVEASSSVMRYLWLGYAAFIEGTGGLFEKQMLSSNNLSSTSRDSASRYETDLRDLQRAEQISRLMLSDFNDTTYYGSEIEHDIYCTGFTSWAMGEITKSFRDALEAAASVNASLYREVTSKRVRIVSILLSFVAVLTVFSAVNDFFEFNRLELNFVGEMNLPYIHWRHDYLDKGLWRLVISFLTVLVMTAMIALVFFFNRGDSSK